MRFIDITAFISKQNHFRMEVKPNQFYQLEFEAQYLQQVKDLSRKKSISSLCIQNITMLIY